MGRSACQHFATKVGIKIACGQGEWWGGSRGNGQVTFKIEKITERSIAYYRDQAKETSRDLADFAL